MSAIIFVLVIACVCFVVGGTFTGTSPSATATHLFGNTFSVSYSPGSRGSDDPAKRAFGWALHITGLLLIAGAIYFGLFYNPEQQAADEETRVQTDKKAVQGKMQMQQAAFQYFTTISSQHMQHMADSNLPKNACTTANKIISCHPGELDTIKISGSNVLQMTASAIHFDEDLATSRYSDRLPVSSKRCAAFRLHDGSLERRPRYVQELRIVVCEANGHNLLLTYPVPTYPAPPDPAILQPLSDPEKFAAYFNKFEGRPN